MLRGVVLRLPQEPARVLGAVLPAAAREELAVHERGGAVEGALLRRGRGVGELVAQAVGVAQGVALDEEHLGLRELGPLDDQPLVARLDLDEARRAVGLARVREVARVPG